MLKFQGSYNLFDKLVFYQYGVAAAARIEIEELCRVAFGTAKSSRHIPVHEIARSLGPSKSIALPMFHAYTGCDMVYSFNTKRKKTEWNTWMNYEEVTLLCLLDQLI